MALDKDGRLLFTIGGKGNSPGEFWYPRGLAIVARDGASELVVCDSWNHRIQRFNLKGDVIGVFGSIGEGEGEFNEPVEVLPGDDGTLWILDRCNHRIRQVDGIGKTIKSFGAGGSSRPSVEDGTPKPVFSYPKSFARIGDKAFIVADTNNRRLCVVGEDGNLISIVKVVFQEKPPYFYPLAVRALNGNIVVVEDSLSTLRLLDVARPWLVKECAFGNPFSRVVSSLSGKTNGATGEFIIVDGKSMRIRRYAVSVDVSLAGEPPSRALPQTVDLKQFPNRWTELERDYWIAYFKSSPPNGENAPLAAEFINTCGMSYLSVARCLAETENDLCLSIVKSYELGEHISAGVIEGKDIRAIQGVRTWESVNAKKLKDTWMVGMSVIAKEFASMAWLLSDSEWRVVASRKLNDVVGLLEKEYDEKASLYAAIMQSLREQCSKPQTINLSGAVYAFSMALILLERLNAIVMTFERLGVQTPNGAIDWESPHTTTLLEFRNNIDRIPYSALALASRYCAMWGYSESELAIYQAMLDRNITDEVDLFYPRHAAMLRIGYDTKAMVDILTSIPDNVMDESLAIEIAKTLQFHGEYWRAQRLMEIFAADKGSQDLKPLWAILVRVRDLATGPNASQIDLSKGQSASAALSKRGLTLREGSSLTYVKSVTLAHPKNGVIITPYFMTPVSPSELLVSDLLGGLYLYTSGQGSRLILHEHKGLITGIERISGNEYLVLVIDGAPDFKFRGFRIVDVSSGATQDYTSRIKATMPDNPFLMTRTDEGKYLICGNGKNKPFERLWLMDADFESGAPVPIPENGPIGDMTTRGDELVLSYWTSNAVYRMSLKDMKGSLIEQRCAVPTGVGIDKFGILYVTNTLGIGLQLYSQDGKPLYGVSSLTDEKARYALHPGCISFHDERFEAGDILIADKTNQAIHIFST